MDTSSANALPMPLYALAHAGRFCELIDQINGLNNPGAEANALRVYALVGCGDMELAFMRLAQLMWQVRREGSQAGALHRWAGALPPESLQLGDLIAAVDTFYQCWDHATYWKAVTNTFRGRALDFIAAAVTDVSTARRIMVAVADSMKLRNEMTYAFEVYLNMCRIRSNPELLENVYATALAVRPEMVYPLLQDLTA